MAQIIVEQDWQGNWYLLPKEHHDKFVELMKPKESPWTNQDNLFWADNIKPYKLDELWVGKMKFEIIGVEGPAPILCSAEYSD